MVINMVKYAHYFKTMELTFYLECRVDQILARTELGVVDELFPYHAWSPFVLGPD